MKNKLSLLLSRVKVPVYGNYQRLRFINTNYYACTISTKDKTNDKINEELNEMVRDASLLKSLIPIFPNPKNTLNSYYNVVQQKIDKDFKLSRSFETRGMSHLPRFLCKLELQGPLKQVFTGLSHQKKAAETIAALKALSALYDENLMTSDGKHSSLQSKPSTKNLSIFDVWTLLRTPLNLHISEDHLGEAHEFILQYKERLRPRILKSIEDFENKLDYDEDSSGSICDLITGKTFSLHDNSLQCFPSNTIDPDNQYESPYHDSFQINSFKDEILQAIEANQIVLIEGGTGCGKSSQVPQMIYKHCMTKDQNCNIVIAQPRRIATLTLSSFIAKEMNQELRKSVGYKMRLDEKLPAMRNSIVFYTSGSLQQVMFQNKTLEGITHIIVDEIHERNVEIDLIMCLLKNIIVQRPDLKVILMSATMNTRILLDYFGAPDEALVRISGHSYPVEVYTAGDLEKTLGIKNFNNKFVNKLKEGIPMNRFMEHSAIVEVVQAIHTKKPPGAILVFLPRVHDIKILLSYLSTNQDMQVFPLHSRLPADKQWLVFEKSPEGLRKIILATNIAETSVTIKDVVYVVDVGLRNYAKYKSFHSMNSMGLDFITKASAIQRAGRAGRVQAGEVYRLYSQEMFDSFPEQGVPEVLTTNLEPQIARIRALIPQDLSLMEFFDSLLDAPHPRAVSQSIKNLVSLGILSIHGNTERLTHIGRVANKIPTTPNLAKSLIYSYFLRCLDPVASLCALDQKISSLINDEISNANFCKLKSHYDKRSDIVASSKLLQDFEFFKYDLKLTNVDEYSTQISCHDLSAIINRNQYKLYQDVKNLLKSSVRNRFKNVDLNQEIRPENLSQMIEVSMLASSLSLYRKLPESNPALLFAQNGSRIVLHRRSTLHNNQEPCLGMTELVLCSDLYYSLERNRVFAREASILNPLAAIIFYGRHSELTDKGDGKYWITLQDQNLTFEADYETAKCLLELRTILTELVDFMIIYKKSEGFNNDVTVAEDLNHRELDEITILEEILTADKYEEVNCNNDDEDRELMTNEDKVNDDDDDRESMINEVNLEEDFVEFSSQFVALLTKLLSRNDVKVKKVPSDEISSL